MAIWKSIGVFLIGVLVVAGATTQLRAGGDIQPFDTATFEAAQAAGEIIVVDIAADWCPTCKAQARVMAKLRDKPEFADYRIMRVNFDTQRDIVREFRAPRQSTLIVFRGRDEVGRVIAQTGEDQLDALWRAALTDQTS